MPFWEKIKDKTQAVQIKMRMLLVENKIDATFLHLGSRTYDLSKKTLPFSGDEQVKSLLQAISSQKQELDRLKEEFRRSWREESRELKVNLEKGDGSLEQVEVSFLSTVSGKRIKDLQLPKEVLLGPILRGKELIIPDGETEILAGDRVTLMGKKKDVDSTAKLLKATS